jgi:hypothetical protein
MGERAWVVCRITSTVVRAYPQHAPVRVDLEVVKPILADSDTFSTWEYAVAYAIGMDWSGREHLAEALMRPLASLLGKHRMLQSMIFTDLDCSSLVMFEIMRRSEGVGAEGGGR